MAAVITLRKPVNGGPKHTTVAPLFKARKMDLHWIETAVEDRAIKPITQLVTAVYSKTDGIVSEYAVLDTQNANVRHVEVSVSHLAMAVNAEVWGIIKGALKSANESFAPH